MLIAYVITRFVFSMNLQYVLFFIACISLSTVVAVIDNEFQRAIEKTKVIESIPITPFEMMKRMKDVPEILEWSRNKHLTVSGPEFFGIHHIYIDNYLKHAIFCPKSDLTLDVFVGTPTEAREWKKYNKHANLLFSKQLNNDSLEWKIYKDIVLYKGKILPIEEIFEKSYQGRIIKVEAFNKNINDQWIVSKVKELYNE